MIEALNLAIQFAHLPVARSQLVPAESDRGAKSISDKQFLIKLMPRLSSGLD